MKLLAVTGVVVVGALTACGASHPSGVGFHSPTGHYTVKQVEEAFAAQGLGLREIKNATSPGVTLLAHGHKKPQLVSVLVLGAQPVDPFHWFGSDAAGRYHAQRDGNVHVYYFDPANTRPVTVALARLH